MGEIVNHIYSILFREGDIEDNDSFQRNAEAEWGNLSVDKRWSNIYNACSLPYKLRSIGLNIGVNDEHTLVRLNEASGLLSETEHNRWNAEQLLIGYRATTKEEHLAIQQNKVQKKELKKRFIHDDIRPYSELDDFTKNKDKLLILNLFSMINSDAKN